MKKRGLFSLLVLAFSILLTAGALALDTVYVNDSGTGDGTRAETPLGSAPRRNRVDCKRRRSDRHYRRLYAVRAF